MRKIIFVLVLASAASLAAAAQDVEKVETNLVTLNVGVSQKGKNVAGLKRDDFVVFDNGVKQDIDAFSAENASVSFGIVYDLHPSTEDRTDSILAALRQFTGGLKGSDDYFVSVFNEKGTLTTDFVPSREQVRDQIEAGPRSLYDAIFAASDKIHSMRNPKKVLLVLTDGADHSSGHSLKELKVHLRTVNLPVYSVTFGPADARQFTYLDMYRDERPRRLGIGETAAMDKGAIADISKKTGGRNYDASLRNQYYLAALFGKALDEVKGQYLLGFYPEKADGKAHSLKVMVKAPGKYKVSSRKGYLSKRQ